MFHKNYICQIQYFDYPQGDFSVLGQPVLNVRAGVLAKFDVPSYSKNLQSYAKYKKKINTRKGIQYKVLIENNKVKKKFQYNK